MMSRLHTAVPTQTPEGRAWLDQHPDVNPAGLERTWRLTDQARALEEAAAVDLSRIEAIRSALDAHTAGDDEARRTDPRDRSPRTRKPFSRWRAIAAAVALLLAAGLSLALRPVTLKAPPGETLAAALPDGSHVDLNSGAALSYRRLFGWTTRAVRLQGEAYFDVTHATTPFIVHTATARITVLGTRFNVQAWPHRSAPETTVTLEGGRVELAARALPEATVVLTPGQMSRVQAPNRAPSDPVAVDVLRTLAWRTGGFAFTDQPLAVIFAEIERRFDVRIRSASGALAAERFSLYVREADRADVLLAMICNALDCRYQTTAQGFDILKVD